MYNMYRCSSKRLDKTLQNSHNISAVVITGDISNEKDV